MFDRQVIEQHLLNMEDALANLGRYKNLSLEEFENDLSLIWIAERGLLIRHLVLPNGLAGTAKVMAYIAGLSRNSYVNIMAQYRPDYRAARYPELSRRISSGEFRDAISRAEEAGLSRGFRHD